MNSIFVAAGTFACCLVGALIGMRLRRDGQDPPAPEKEGAMSTAALVAAIAVLVLALFAVAKTSFDEAEATVGRTAEALLEADRALADFGPDAEPLRVRLKSAAVAWFDGVSSPRFVALSKANAPARTESFDEVVDGIRGLLPHDDRQRALQARALERTEASAHANHAILESQPSGVSPAFVAIVVFWLAATFTSYALYRRAKVTLAGPVLGALAAAGAMFLIIELGTPFRGAIQVSDEPVRRALDLMNAPPR